MNVIVISARLLMSMYLLVIKYPFFTIHSYFTSAYWREFGVLGILLITHDFNGLLFVSTLHIPRMDLLFACLHLELSVCIY